jgi:lipoate-protein ligase A
MAIDAALMDRARTSAQGVVRVYSWREPTLSLGRNERATGVYSNQRADECGVRIVRRMTGGRALLHNREITTGQPLARTYHEINTVLLESLRAMGVAAEIARPTVRAPKPGSAPCFEQPSAGELIFQGRKLVGSAQYRENGAMLQQGSILVHDDQPLIARLALHAGPTLPPAATLFDALGVSPSPTEFAEVLFTSVRARWDATASLLVEPTWLADDLDRARSHFSSAEWTWRR